MRGNIGELNKMIGELIKWFCVSFLRTNWRLQMLRADYSYWQLYAHIEGKETDWMIQSQQQRKKNL
jgi:hypothetical protein